MHDNLGERLPSCYLGSGSVCWRMRHGTHGSLWVRCHSVHQYYRYPKHLQRRLPLESGICKCSRRNELQRNCALFSISCHLSAGAQSYCYPDYAGSNHCRCRQLVGSQPAVLRPVGNRLAVLLYRWLLLPGGIDGCSPMPCGVLLS